MFVFVIPARMRVSACMCVHVRDCVCVRASARYLVGLVVVGDVGEAEGGEVDRGKKGLLGRCWKGNIKERIVCVCRGVCLPWFACGCVFVRARVCV